LLNCIAASLYSNELKLILGSGYKSGKCKGENYEQFYSRINCENVNFPAGINDIKVLEKNNPNFRFHIWTIKDSDYYKVYETKVTEHHKSIEKTIKNSIKNIHTVLVSYRNKQTVEIDHHFLHVYDLNKFTAKKYSTGFEKILACPHCARKFHSLKHNKMNQKYLKHCETCIYDTTTRFEMPEKNRSNLCFTHFKYTHPYRFAIFADFETLNKPIPCLCIACNELYQIAPGLKKKDEIVQKCKTEKHKAYNFSNCIKCVQAYLLIKKQFSTFCKKERHIISDISKNMCSICETNCELDIIKQIAHSTECDNNCINCKNRDKCSHTSTENLTRLDPIIYCIVVYDQKFDKIYKIEEYVGDDCVKKFIETLEKLELELTELIHVNQPLDINTIPKNFNIDNEKKCYVCLEPFIKNHEKNFDHCHHTGKFRGISCTRCNLQMVEQEKCNVYIHNLSGFDSHLLIAEYSSSKKTDLKAIPINSQKSKILQFGSFYNILDSLSFQPQSLSNLTETLKKEKARKKDLFNIIASAEDLCFTNGKFDLEKYNLCLEKAGFPYEMATSIIDLKKIKVFPDKKYFKSSLTGKDIDYQTYENGKKMFALNKFQNMLQYYIWYCKLDTVLLTEIMIDFKKRSFESFNLSIDGYWTLSSYALNCCLKKTQANIELITDRSQYDFVESSKRGGLTLAIQRFASSSEGDKILKKHFNHLIDDNFLKASKTKDNYKKYIFDLDFNNLYGGEQTKHMPHHSFKWASSELCTELEKYYYIKSCQIANGDKKIETWVDFHGINKNLKAGEKEEFFLDIDFKYPKKKHHQHSNFPLAPQNFDIQHENLSPKASELLNELRPNPTSYKSEKLTTTLLGLQNYVVHSSLLDFYVSQGLIVKKINRALSFVSSNFLNSWIQHCTYKRKLCVSRGDSVGKNFWKLMINR